MAAPRAGHKNCFQQMRNKFCSQLPARVKKFRSMATHADTDATAAEELKRLFHNLKGTAAIFGFEDLRKAASKGEEIVDSFQLDKSLLMKIIDEIERIPVASDTQCAGTQVDFSNLPSDTKESACDGEQEKLIYICDDDPLTLSQLATQISCFGYKVEGFLDIASLEEGIKSKRPACVVLDISFPQSHNDGTDFILRARSEFNPPLTAVFISARDDYEARLGAVKAGGSAYFVKPVEVPDLVATLDRLCNPRESQPFRILIVDDEPTISAYHASVLVEAGMLTLCVDHPKKVLEAIKSFGPDIIILDLYMPGCSGIELASVIRQIPEYVSLPIVYLSGESDEQKHWNAKRVGAEGFLVKPIKPAALISEVSIRAERTRTLRELILRDSLTGLLNHSATLQLLEKTISSSDRSGSPLVFGIIDIDHFKKVNDSYGHRAGDQVLAALARMLEQQLRQSDIVGRHGGEEFSVVLPGSNLENAFTRIDKMRSSFAQIEFSHGDQTFHCTFSAGVAQYNGSESLTELFGAADKAMYEAKNSGRNKVIMASRNKI